MANIATWSSHLGHWGSNYYDVWSQRSSIFYLFGQGFLWPSPRILHASVNSEMMMCSIYTMLECDYPVLQLRLLLFQEYWFSQFCSAFWLRWRWACAVTCLGKQYELIARANSIENWISRKVDIDHCNGLFRSWTFQNSWIHEGEQWSIIITKFERMWYIDGIG